MHVTKLKEHIDLVDVETAGFENFIASYVLRGKSVAIIETGPTSSVPNLLTGLGKLGVKLEDVTYVAVSHVHLDHGGGAGTLLKSLPNAKVIVHQRGAPHLANPEKLWQQSREILSKITELYGEPEPVPPERIIAAEDGMTFDLGKNVEFKVVETLGHASHHQSYYETFGRGVFPGDAAGIYLREFDAIVPTTPAPFRLDSALVAVDKLISLKPKALYYSHFGDASNPVGRLKAYAEQLRLWAKIAQQGIQEKRSLEEVRQNIIENDRQIQKAVKFIEAHPVLNETVLNNSVQGFMQFAEKCRDNPS
ncbi:MAG: MBL fold metallo-hydrolase [Candidatus Bathyarchaeia archaeon]|jgi:glyoxylase-like metal-dependent hydrolase (beta-lactamase superfamily II)